MTALCVRIVIVLALCSVGWGISGCKNSLLDRSLIFTTNTTTGLELSANPTQTAGSPLKLIAGFKRQELAIVPVYDRYGITGSGGKKPDGTPSEAGTGDKYRKEAYSVIAKIASTVGGRVNTSAQTAPRTPGGEVVEGAFTGNAGLEGHLNNAQWFATGEAAKILAKHRGILGAVVGSPSMSIAAEQGGPGLAGFVGEGRAFAMASLILLYESIDSAAIGGDAVAEGIRAKMNQAATSVKLPDPGGFSLYERRPQVDAAQSAVHDASGEEIFALRKITNVDSRLAGLTEFQRLMVYSKILRDSADAIDAEIAETDTQVFDAAGTPKEVADESLLKREANRQRAADNEFAQALSKHDAFREALTEIYTQYILGPKGAK